jgi:hypothetical protein
MAKKKESLPAQKPALPIIKWDGAKIKDAGVYDMPIEAYHGDCCVLPSISSSGLRKIDSQSPAHYFDSSYLNPNRDTSSEEKAEFILGRAAHMLLLGESGFKEKFVLRPDEAPDGRAWNGNNNSCKEWLKQARASGKTVILKSDLEIIQGMAKSLAQDPLVQSGILNGEVERSLIWKDGETGVYLKARPDALPCYADLVSDLKTIASADRRSLQYALDDHAYHVQLALVWEGMKAVLGRTLSDEDFVLVFVEKRRPYCVNVAPIDPRAIYYGRCIIRRAVRKFADCLSTDKWPGYETSGETLGLSKRSLEWLEQQIKAGLLPEAEV